MWMLRTPSASRARKLDTLLLGSADEDVFDLKRLVEILVEHRIVKVGIGNGHKQRIDHKARSLARSVALLAQQRIDRSDAASGIEQLDHTGRVGRSLAANADDLTSFPFGSLLTLVTEHFVHTCIENVRVNEK